MDIFSTAVLAHVIANLKLKPNTFFLDKYFGQEQRSQTEDIYFDTEQGRRRMSPFVSPLVQGKIVASDGYKTSSFRPAYVKDKRAFDPNKPMRRAIGEQIGGALTPQDRLMVNLRTELENQINLLVRRQEWMATQALLTATITVTGEGYPTKVVDFGRDAALTVPLSSPNCWSDSGINPLNDLQDWSLLVLQKSGTSPVDVVMTTDVWKVFRENSFVKARWNTLNEFRAPLDMGAVSQTGGTLKGNIDGFNIYVYADWYIDDNGTEQPMLPTGTVLLLSPQVDGVRAYGAIRDEEAGYQPVPYYAKSWVEKDPSVRYLLMQSAPLVVPYRPDASLAATVL